MHVSEVQLNNLPLEGAYDLVDNLSLLFSAPTSWCQTSPESWY